MFMHGLQCTPADHTGTAPVQSAAISAHGEQPPSAVTAMAAAMPVAQHNAVIPAPDQAAVAGAAAHGRSDTSPHSGAGHLWSLCLAVLAAGLALLLALAGPRLLRHSRTAALPAFTRAAKSVTLLRPPELSALCVLRI
ncbi:hypothetical protein [Blastococcus aurantiacus]|nr:hypothetical protein [Blastococcus aurantiacus]